MVDGPAEVPVLGDLHEPEEEHDPEEVAEEVRDHARVERPAAVVPVEAGVLAPELVVDGADGVVAARQPRRQLLELHVEQLGVC